MLDATGEALGAILRPGNAGSNTTADHVELLAQLPVDPEVVEIVARADSAALTHGFINACRDAHVRFSVGHDLTEPVLAACLRIPKRRWAPAVTVDGQHEREGAKVAETTYLVDLSRWPEGTLTQAIARREEPHPGAHLTFTDVDGHRFQVFVTDQTDTDIAYLELVPRVRPGGLLLADNVLWSGRIVDESSDDAATQSLQRLQRQRPPRRPHRSRDAPRVRQPHPRPPPLRTGSATGSWESTVAASQVPAAAIRVPSVAVPAQSSSGQVRPSAR